MKSSLTELAIFGGPPIFAQALHVGRPNVGQRQALLTRINDILDRRWLTNNGLYLQEFEQRLATMLGVKHCVAVASGTTALEIAIRAAGLSGEVIVPAMTFVATAHALQWLGLTPIFCDIEPDSSTINPNCIEQLITPRTSAILGVHLWGRPCNIAALTDLARQYHLKLLFDAAHAIGCSYQGQMIGNFGDAEIFSFHATKIIHTFEGGAIATNQDELAAQARLMRNFGFANYDEVISLGINGKMNEVSAAMGLTLLESFEELVAANYCNYQHYQQALKDIPGLDLIRYDQHERGNYQYVIVELNPAVAGLSRDQLLAVLQAENILARRYFYPGCHRLEPYRSNPAYAPARLNLPVTDRLAARILALPTGTAIGLDEISQICQIIRLALKHSPKIPCLL